MSILFKTDDWYWSINELNVMYVWYKFFTDGFEYHNLKTLSGYVRAVRKVAV